jgi:hypothetical protein
MQEAEADRRVAVAEANNANRCKYMTTKKTSGDCKAMANLFQVAHIYTIYTKYLPPPPLAVNIYLDLTALHPTAQPNATPRYL